MKPAHVTEAAKLIEERKLLESALKKTSTVSVTMIIHSDAPAVFGGLESQTLIHHGPSTHPEACEIPEQTRERVFNAMLEDINARLAELGVEV